MKQAVIIMKNQHGKYNQTAADSVTLGILNIYWTKDTTSNPKQIWLLNWQTHVNVN